MRFLVVDDDQIDRMAIKRHLSNLSDAEIYEAETGAQAQLAITENKFDCIFLDYQLPDMDGIKFLKSIYDQEKDLAVCPVIMLTGHGSESIMLEALRYGAQDYLVKDNISQAAINVSVVKTKEVFELKQSRKNAQEQLLQAQKMEAIGQLTSGIAHDFNNLLTVVLGNARLIRRKIEQKVPAFSEEDLTKKIEAIEMAAQRGADLVRRLMIFTRQSAPKRELIDINKKIEEVVSFLQQALGKTIEVKIIPNKDLWLIMADASQFDNMIINLAINARDAMKGQGQLTIKTENIEIKNGDIVDGQLIVPGQYILTCVSDTGSGMKKEILNKIFEPFFTTKAAGEGTGLGLSMVYGFVQQSGGYIRILSEEGNGSLFKIYLPRYEENNIANENNRLSSMPSGSETILIVDNRADVRGLTKHFLEQLGYKIFSAENIRTATEIIKMESKKIDLVFIDSEKSADVTQFENAIRGDEYENGIKILNVSNNAEEVIGDDLANSLDMKQKMAGKIREVLDGA